MRARLWLQVLVAMGAGVATGMAIGPTGGWLAPATAQLVSNWVAMPGYLFLAMVQMIVIPLVVASIILGMASSRDMQQLRSMGLRTGLFFVFTTLVAAAIGLVVALAVQPGSYLQGAELPTAAASVAATSAPPSLTTLPLQIVRIVPTNPCRPAWTRTCCRWWCSPFSWVWPWSPWTASWPSRCWISWVPCKR
ncbi:MAG: cation:dicarboxylase symporter family transporter [Burkholderiaceae bacterium]